MYATMSELDLCSLKPEFALGKGLDICRHWFCLTLLENFGLYKVVPTSLANNARQYSDVLIL